MQIPRLKPLVSSIAKSVSALAILATSASADLVITYAGQPGESSSLVPNASEFDFNALPLGLSKNVSWDGVGTFDSLYILPADAFGGALGSKYSVQSIYRDGLTASTLTFNTPVAYFGLWWSAGDANNVLEFYSAGNLLFSFTTESLLNRLNATEGGTYNGNPYRDSDNNAGEKYAYLNFFGQDGSTWDKIVLTNIGNTGFESDNYSVRKEAWSVKEGDMPGKYLETVTAYAGRPAPSDPNVSPVPEPGSMLALAGLISAGAFLRSRRR